jgi:integrase
MWIATLGSRGFETGSDAIEAEPLVIVDLVGKGGRLRTVPVPAWCKGLLDVWLRYSGVSEGKVFRRVLKGRARQDKKLA